MGVNVQPYSGSPRTSLPIMPFLSHTIELWVRLTFWWTFDTRFYTDKKISATSIYFEFLPYRIKEDGYIDYTI